MIQSSVLTIKQVNVCLTIKQVNGVAFFSDDTKQPRPAAVGTAVITAVCLVLLSFLQHFLLHLSLFVVLD